jgi:DNA anti-recombination protein RmuC
MRSVANHFSALGKQLDASVGRYNDALGSLESRCL